jgi:hypothetical protein
MMVAMLTVIGQLSTSEGLVQQRDGAGDPIPWTMRANSYLRDQKAGLPILMDHDPGWPVGGVGYLQRSAASGLLMVGRLADDSMADLLNDGDWYLSGGTNSHATGVMEYGLATLREASLVRATGSIGTRPVCWSKTDIAKNSGAQPPMPLFWRSCWDAAHVAMSSYRYKRAGRLPIVDIDELSLYDEAMTDPAAARRRAILMRAAALPPSRPKIRASAPRPAVSTQEPPLVVGRLYRHTYPGGSDLSSA